MPPSQYLHQRPKAFAFLSMLLSQLIEAYDFTIYGFMSLTLSKVFFPKHSGNMAVILILLIFAIGFVARPLGAIIFGIWGDKKGRKYALLTSIMLMGIPTFLIAILPGYPTWGITAAILLTLLRFIQGISAGGDWAGTIVYLFESAEPHKKAFYAGLSIGCMYLGVLVAAIVNSILTNHLSNHEMLSYGWRIAFFVGVGIIIIAILGRWAIKESHDYTIAHKNTPHRPKLGYKFWLKMTISSGVISAAALINYVLFVYLPTYMQTHLTFSKSSIHDLSIATILVTIIASIATGIFYSYLQKTIYIVSVLIALIIIPATATFFLSSQGIVGWAVIDIITAILFGCLATLTFLAIVASFNPLKRYRGFAISYNLSYAIFGGTGPVIAALLIRKTHDFLAVMLYFSCIGVLALICLTFLNLLNKKVTNIKSNAPKLSL